jgi:Methylamine utilisation protein MauE
MFTVAIAWALHRGLNISCGCFGMSGNDRITHLTLIRTVLMLAASIVAYVVVILQTEKRVAEDRALPSQGRSLLGRPTDGPMIAGNP